MDKMTMVSDEFPMRNSTKKLVLLKYIEALVLIKNLLRCIIIDSVMRFFFFALTFCVVTAYRTLVAKKM